MKALIVAEIWQLAGERSATATVWPNARIEAAVPLNTMTILAKFDPAPTALQPVVDKPSKEAPNSLVAAGPDALSTSGEQAELSDGRMLADANTTGSIPSLDDASPPVAIHTDRAPVPSGEPAPAGSTAWAKQEMPCLKYYVYSELTPPEKPPTIALAALSDVPIGTPIEEIKRAADVFGLDEHFLKGVGEGRALACPTRIR